ncbi:bifunctional phosphopantothenoylcysteine decarboxylase/phosphopantothenate--cysteine ligase CoaBC [Alkalihalobacterium chitinilyticum]|uniref:Coenzyme A biosynthesis bifunctional protein CoaBC n=1 Tax=Alkalihalobacterium chitinilyticum TaxID=2980103 RepID=A0ABT5VC34_9BACI|nr:bifunctional phosphopantothenoylcysteine decarboxylase/phosphopantothenate--cysteine ligase CoaBC [Alkalihalobacterium chitinilyticum]MDE5413021.1 bifunctional phosphopantothenoylcysteine decarboxylase/phosphopantothenate--cysteine ligase CoaBC [Alkalihalobacterium chitinilyticum]
MLKGKKILLCVTGGVAVFKAAALTSKLSQAGATVKVMMTKSAEQFVTPLTFQTLSRQPVYNNTFDEKDPSGVAHIDLADWPDLILIAPATANMIGKLANGIADDMISTTLLATTAPVLVAPAMNVHMYAHPAVVNNLNKLNEYGYHFIEPDEGFLACGYVGKGRLAEPEQIIERLHQFFSNELYQPLKGKQFLITAGPTQEKIDPVRYITNHSSGKMGYQIAEAAAGLGAEVTLISGPTQLATPKGVTRINVDSAQDMYEAVMEHFASTDVVVKTAAVADYRPKVVHAEKMKKKPGDAVIELERTTDILATLGELKKHQTLVGFAAETEKVEEYAKGKLERKNLDLIVANNITEAGAGFKGDTNKVTIYKKNGETIELPIMTKRDVAEQLLAEIINYEQGNSRE